MSPVSIELEQKTVELQTKIRELSQLSDCDLKDAMNELKKALTENAEASLLLLPEDVGEIVRHLKKVTGKALQTAASKKQKSTEKSEKAKEKAFKTMTAEELESGWNDL